RIQDDPEALTQFVHRLKDRHVRPQDLQNCLEHATETHHRFALLLGLGEFTPEEAGPVRSQLKETLLGWYRNDPSSAIHGACGWLLRTWGFGAEAEGVDRTPLAYDPSGRRNWFVEQVGEDYFTFVVFRPGTFVMGSPPAESYRQLNEQQ